ARIESPQSDDFDNEPQQCGSRQRDEQGKRKAARPNLERCGEVRADHVQRPMRQVDEVHDAAYEREPCSHQEEHHAQLGGVQRVFEQNRCAHHLPQGWTRSLQYFMTHLAAYESPWSDRIFSPRRSFSLPSESLTTVAT